MQIHDAKFPLAHTVWVGNCFIPAQDSSPEAEDPGWCYNPSFYGNKDSFIGVVFVFWLQHGSEFQFTLVSCTGGHHSQTNSSRHPGP